MLGRPKFRARFDRARQDLIFGLLAAEAVYVDPVEAVSDCRDSKDNRYLEMALAAGAQVIVSSDQDLLVLDPWRGIRIVTPAGYVAMVEAARR